MQFLVSLVSSLLSELLDGTNKNFEKIRVKVGERIYQIITLLILEHQFTIIKQKKEGNVSLGKVILHIDVTPGKFLSWEAVYRLYHLGGSVDLRGKGYQRFAIWRCGMGLFWQNLSRQNDIRSSQGRRFLEAIAQMPQPVVGTAQLWAAWSGVLQRL